MTIEEDEDEARELSTNPPSDYARNQLIADFGEVWDQFELAEVFTLGAFVDPHYEAVRISDSWPGTLQVQLDPLYFHSWLEDEPIAP